MWTFITWLLDILILFDSAILLRVLLCVLKFEIVWQTLHLNWRKHKAKYICMHVWRSKQHFKKWLSILKIHIAIKLYNNLYFSFFIAKYISPHDELTLAIDDIFKRVGFYYNIYQASISREIFNKNIDNKSEIGIRIVNNCFTLVFTSNNYFRALNMFG